MINISDEQLVNLYLLGSSTVELSKKFNVSRGVIRYRLAKNGVSCRPRAKVNLEDLQFKEGTPEFDYFLGVLATDGCICNEVISLEFSKDNLEILNNWKTFLGDKVNIVKHKDHRDNRTYYKISFMSKQVVEYLKIFGITERKSFTIKLKYINWNVLLGIFDGDGSLVLDLRKNHSWRFKIVSASKQFILLIKDFLEENNITPSISKERNWYILSVGKIKDLHTIYSNIYKESSYFLHRKYEKFCPLVEKFTRKNSVNSVKGRDYHKTEPSLSEEGAETRNGMPKLQK